jgi:diguanylate cyclase
MLKEFLQRRSSQIKRRLDDEKRMEHLLTVLATVIALLVSITVPSAYYMLTREAEIRESTLTARLHASFVSMAIDNSQGDWRKQVVGLIATDLTLSRLPESRKIVDRYGIEVERAGVVINGSALVSEAPILSSQGIVGSVIILRSLEPILLTTALVALIAAAVGAAIYFLLRTLPLKALRRTLEALKATEAKTRAETQENLKVIFENTPDGILLCAQDGKIQSCNQSTSLMLGYPESELQKMFLSDLLHGTSPTKDLNRVQAIQCEATMKRRNGDHVAVDVTVSESNTENHSRRIAIVRDITEKQNAQQRLANIANYDGLTGLANRSLFRQRLQEAIERSDDNGESFTLMFLDLDRFKTINDSLGHEFGDRLLQLVASELATCLRENDFITRYTDVSNDIGAYRLGGDEFTVLLENIPNQEIVATIAKRILHTLSQPFQVGIHQLFISVSIGITEYPQVNASTDLETLIKQADLAMYRSKSLGRDTYSFFTQELQVIAKEQHKLESKLRHALDRNEYKLVYQPKANLSTGAIVGVEALLRWQPEHSDEIGPDKFIPILEESGLIVPVGMWVMKTACQQLEQWHAAGLTELTMAVNLSARQFRQTDLLEQIGGIINSTNVPHGQLEIELTESTLVEDSEAVVQIMQSLRQMDVKVAIDDFGTGHSSLRYLKRFSIDTLKIDRSFVKDIPHDAEDNAITIAVIALGQALGLKVVAEGVETTEQADFLKAHGCDEIQGFWLGKPMSPEQFAHWVTEKRTILGTMRI